VAYLYNNLTVSGLAYICNIKIKEILMKFTAIIYSLAIISLIAACGDRPGERALSGAGIGAGVGAVGGAITGADPVTSAVVGGAVGAAAGGLTKKKDINLGDPAWK
jgi:hypothetical protein